MRYVPLSGADPFATISLGGQHLIVVLVAVAVAVVQGCELAVPDLPRHHRNGHRRRSMRELAGLDDSPTLFLSL
ncbi:hypothetical protein Acr_03g0012300 [Actinidia rufa]|uniref:Uncharacterized protein n=1 Tax=Actinidia rufa TaxID=165716 RepID=A0A7J0EE51_9ERIC|nr:hypothetical protein Acr_03g0012300 [Actinidia rufa]